MWTTILKLGFAIFLVCIAILKPAYAEQRSKWLVVEPITPGVQLELKEIDRVALDDGSMTVRYSIRASGFPIEKSYSLWFHRMMDEPSQLANEMSAGNDGQVVIKSENATTNEDSPTILLSSVPFSFISFSPGEGLRISIVSDDETVQAHALEFPVPIQDSDGNCHLYVEVFNRGQTMFRVIAQGFEPNEEVQVEAQSNGEIMKSLSRLGSGGVFWRALMPQVLGKEAGLARYRVVGRSCSVEVEFEWGIS